MGMTVATMHAMRVDSPSLLPLAAVLLAAATVSQTRQFEQEYYRVPDVLLSGSFPSFAVGDVDGDGDLDVLATLFNPWIQTSSTILFRQDPGGWQSTTLLATPAFSGQQPVFTPVFVELDGDGAIDVAVLVLHPSSASSRIELFANDGTGTLVAATTLPMPGAISAEIAAADVDDDNDKDLIVAVHGAAGSLLTLYEHDGSFGFQPVAGAMPTTPASAPFAIDLDGDGDMDVVAAAAGGGVLALTNQGGTFTGGLIATTTAQYVVGNDLDGDGDQDLVVQQIDGGMVLLENATSGFQSHTLTIGGSSAGQRPELADFDGDQDLDVAFHTGGELRVLRNNGSAVFTVEPVVATLSFGVGDVDLDGVADVLFQASDVGIATGLARIDRFVMDPVYSRRRYIADASAGLTEDTADFENDGLIDLVQQTYYRVYLRCNHGAGEWSTIRFEVPFLRPRVRAADVDGDGDEDVVVINNDAAGGLQVFRNDGPGIFTPLPQQALASAWIKGKGDFDGDMQDDLLISTGSNILLLRSTGGTFAPPVLVFSGASSSTVSMPGIWDYDGDQDLDLIVRQNAGNCAVLLSNDGSGNFSVADPCLALLPGGTIKSLALVDIDRDGDPDLFTWGYGSGQLQINHNGSYVPGQVIQSVTGSSLLKPWFADLNDDGYPDLLQLGGSAQVWINSTTGTLVNESAARVSSQFTGAGVADLDGDGDIDHISPFGTFSDFHANHHRSATSLVMPTAGGQMQVRYAHEPGYASGNAVCIPILALQRRFTPLAVPGIRGLLQIDLTTSIAMPLLAFPATTGTAVSSFSIPAIPGLLGFDLYAQGLVFGPTPGWTPAVHERVL